MRPSTLSPTRQAALDEQLRQAAWADDVERAAALVARGADVDAKDETEQSAFLIATSEGYLELLDLTLEQGARIEAKDSWNGTGLIRAAERGHHRVVGRLLEAGVEKDHVNRIGYQAIHEAVWLGEDTASYVDTIRVLVAGGVELTRRSRDEGLTALEMARQRGHGGQEQALARAVEPLDLPDPDASLLRAAEAGDADRVARALRAGADPERRDPTGATALQLARASGRTQVERLLVATGAVVRG